ncbi:hypothetical protein ACXYL9_07285 [Qipengyuania sp. CAU 1752]
MTKADNPVSAEAPVEAVLREELAHGDVVLGTVEPILGHLLANHDHSLFSDEIVAGVRGMLTSIAYQMLEVQAQVVDETDPHGFASRNAGELATSFASGPGVLAHCHALAIECNLAQRLQSRSSIDPVLSPLLQSLIASDEVEIASLAMQALASQARFIQHQKRMHLPITELPADLFHQALTSWHEFSEGLGETVTDRVETILRKSFDESRTRLGLLTRLVEGMGGGVRAALTISHSGSALFLTALASISQQPRDVVALSTNDRQMARLALGLRGAGLNAKEVSEQFIYLHPDVSLPEGFSQLRADRAQAILDSSAGWRAD